MSSHKKIPVGISKTNVNRLKYQTHTVERVFQLEQIQWCYPRTTRFIHPTTGEEACLGDVEFVAKKKAEVVVKTKTKEVSSSAAPEQTSTPTLQ